jgi:hypothetical protein
MAQIEIQGSSLGNALTEMLMAPEIQPGDQPSYQLCKTIYTLHPLGSKIAETPIAKAQSQEREISVTDGPEDRVREQFKTEWSNLGADAYIYNIATLAKVYGIASIAMVAEGVDPNAPIDPWKLADLNLSFPSFDPLNTAGSLVLNQDPLAFDFQKVTTIAVSGVRFHRSRTITLMNERPVYISYTSSAFGFVGRSAYQRALFPLKSFIQTMQTDDLITKKAGVFIAMLKSAGAIITNIMSTVAGLKRLFVKQATNGNVISIGVDEKIETLNMQNIDGAYGMARKNILENIAVAVPMPARWLNHESFAEGFGEGSEDAKDEARHVDRYRKELKPIYDFFDMIVMYRAWNKDFFATMQEEFPERYGIMKYKDAFYQWKNSFSAKWPSLLIEPDSEKVKTDDVKLKAIIAVVQIMLPAIQDPENKAKLVEWMQDNVNENRMMFKTPLELDIEAIATYEPPQPVAGEAGSKEPPEPKPFAAADSVPMHLRIAAE